MINQVPVFCQFRVRVLLVELDANLTNIWTGTNTRAPVLKVEGSGTEYYGEGRDSP